MSPPYAASCTVRRTQAISQTCPRAAAATERGACFLGHSTAASCTVCKSSCSARQMRGSPMKRTFWKPGKLDLLERKTS